MSPPAAASRVRERASGGRGQRALERLVHPLGGAGLRGRDVGRRRPRAQPLGERAPVEGDGFAEQLAPGGVERVAALVAADAVVVHDDLAALELDAQLIAVAELDAQRRAAAPDVDLLGDDVASLRRSGSRDAPERERGEQQRTDGITRTWHTHGPGR
jgi:hypothetical protein